MKWNPGRLLPVLFFASPPAAAFAQEIVTAPEFLLTELRAEPLRPELGVPFELHLVLRLPAALIPVPSDTLLPAEGTEGAGPGRWESRDLPGDSVEIRAVYPVVAFREGIVILPTLELQVGGAGGANRERRLLRLGAVTIDPMEPAEGESPLQPRGSAGVLGGGWSLWRILALLTGVGGALFALAGGWVLLRRRNSGKGGIGGVGLSPREEAIQALDALRGSGVHREGRLVEFYSGTTGAVRRYASRRDGRMGEELTTTELMGRMEGGWGEGSSAGIEPVADVAERVKFGRLRPEADAAEQDWEEVREWIRRAPEGE